MDEDEKHRERKKMKPAHFYAFDENVKFIAGIV